MNDNHYILTAPISSSMVKISSTTNAEMTKTSCRVGFEKVWKGLSRDDKIKLREKMESSGRTFDDEGKCSLMQQELVMEWACQISRNGKYDNCVVEIGGEAGVHKNSQSVGTIHLHPFQSPLRTPEYSLEPPFMSDKDMPSAFRSAIWEHDEGTSRYHCIHMAHQTVCYDLDKYDDEVSEKVNEQYGIELDRLEAQNPSVYGNDAARMGYILSRLVRDGWVTEKRGQDLELE